MRPGGSLLVPLTRQRPRLVLERDERSIASGSGYGLPLMLTQPVLEGIAFATHRHIHLLVGGRVAMSVAWDGVERAEWTLMVLPYREDEEEVLLLTPEVRGSGGMMIGVVPREGDDWDRLLVDLNVELADEPWD